MNVHEVMMAYLRGLTPEDKKQVEATPIKPPVKGDPRRRDAMMSALRGLKTPKDKNKIPFSRPTTEPYVS